MRLDCYLSENGMALSRNKAQELIREGKVAVDGVIITKPSWDVGEGSAILVLEEKHYVSRAAYKLKGFLEGLDLDIKGARCLDVGSSTGGFCEVLLEKGASQIVAVDVGRMQLHEKLKNDPRVISYEETDIRDFADPLLFDLVTCDVSFVSVLHLLGAIDALVGGFVIILFKPQYEVGKDARRDSCGVVIDKEAVKEAQKRFEDACSRLEWKLVKKEESKLKGKEGNVEWFYCYAKNRSFGHRAV